MSFELRWIVPNVTTTEPPRLQQRVIVGWVIDAYGHTKAPEWSDWADIPTVVVPAYEFNRSTSA